MKLSFGNMTLKMNIFNICKQPGDDNDCEMDEIANNLVCLFIKETLSNFNRMTYK